MPSEQPNSLAVKPAARQAARQPAAAHGEEWHPPLQGAARYIATVAIAMASLMVSLDMTIANVAIPTIVGDLGVTPAQGSWIVTSYTVANALCMLLSGWLARRFGQVRLFISAIICFTAASALCGIATSLWMLVLARVVQGAAAGPMMTLAMTLVLQCYPPEKAATALASQIMVSMMGPATGPVIGGWITEHFSWPWIFYINIPVALLAVTANWVVLKDRESRRHRDPVDLVGLLLVVLWVGALQLMLEKGTELDWFESPAICLMAVIAFVGFCFFLVWEAFEDHPVVDFSFFSKASFNLGVLANFTNQALFFGGNFLINIWMQQTIGYSATWAGLVTAPGGLVAVILQPLAAKLQPRLPLMVPVVVGGLLLAGAGALRAGFTSDLGAGDVLLPQLLIGMATSIVFVPLTIIVVRGVPAAKMPSATSLLYFLRFSGAAFGTSLAASYWIHRTGQHHAALIAHINPFDLPAQSAMRAVAGAGLDQAQSLSLLERLTDIQAQTAAADDYYLVAAALFLSVIPLVWLAHSKTDASAPPPVIVEAGA